MTGSAKIQLSSHDKESQRQPVRRKNTMKEGNNLLNYLCGGVTEPFSNIKIYKSLLTMESNRFLTIVIVQ